MSKGANWGYNLSSVAGLGEEFGKFSGVRTWQELMPGMLE